MRSVMLSLIVFVLFFFAGFLGLLLNTLEVNYSASFFYVMLNFLLFFWVFNENNKYEEIKASITKGKYIAIIVFFVMFSLILFLQKNNPFFGCISLLLGTMLIFFSYCLFSSLKHGTRDLLNIVILVIIAPPILMEKFSFFKRVFNNSILNSFINKNDNSPTIWIVPLVLILIELLILIRFTTFFNSNNK